MSEVSNLNGNAHFINGLNGCRVENGSVGVGKRNGFTVPEVRNRRGLDAPAWVYRVNTDTSFQRVTLRA